MFNLAISNIAWSIHNAPEVLNLLHSYKVSGIEVAPSKVWPGWEGASLKSAQEYRKFLADQGFEVPAMQALLFGKNHFQVFDSSTHTEFLAHMRLAAEIANGLGAQALVFGSPKNRRRGRLGYLEAKKQAAGLFKELGKICQDNNCVLGLEANPAEYSCDFLNNTFDVVDFVNEVDSPGIKVHFDSGASFMNHENIVEALLLAGDICHYHISEPGLNNLGAGQVDIAGGLKALKQLNYRRWVSIEMRQEEPELLKLEEALKKVVEAADNVKK